MSTIEPFTAAGSANEVIRGYVNRPEGPGPFPVVLLAHGFKGFADYGFLPRLADRLAEGQLATVRFSFSHCGIEDDPSRFTRPDLFEQDTFGHQVTDILALIQAAQTAALPGGEQLDGQRIGIVGHSRGGVSAILATGRTRALRAIVTLATPDRTLDEATREQLRQTGRVRSPSGRTGDELFMGRALVDDIDAAGEAYDLPRLLGRYHGAFLAVHCRGDDTVDAAASDRLADAHTTGPTDRLILNNGNHTFGFRHGQPGTTGTLETAAARVTAFLRRHLQA